MADEDNGNVVEAPASDAPQRIHLVGVGGTGMGSFAGMLKAAGHQVTGSDENVYPPMSDMLKAWGIPVLTPYRAENLAAAKPDLVIMGNVIRRVNVEAAEVRRLGLPQMSFPSALGHLFLAKKHAVVVAGTHGKTTTSAMMAHVLADAGRDPSFLVGGVTQNFAGNYRIGQGAHFVVEGDEYDTAYWDKGPKFLHYQPRTAFITSVEFDHADIYRDLAHYEASFERLVKIMPEDGHLVVSASYPNALRLAAQGKARVTTYSANGDLDADFLTRRKSFSKEGSRFEVSEKGRVLGWVSLPLSGVHNIENALGVIAAAQGLGLSFEEIAKGLETFGGVKRRQEVRAELNDILVIDDFAHHPTAVRETVLGIHQRYPERRVWAIFEPRSNTSRRNIHQEDYAHAFTGAVRVSLKVPEHHDKVPLDQELNVPLLVEALKRQGLEAEGETQVAALVALVSREARPGDVLLVMSNGAFGGFIEQLLSALRQRMAQP